MWVEASAPSNIALIKYMGKSDPSENKPTNSSFSYCLENLRTFVRIKKNESLKQDSWACLVRDDLRKIELTEKGQAKFLKFFEVLKNEFKMVGFFEIESANNFPSDCGLASSASSFAALTLAAHNWYLQNANGRHVPYRPKELAKLSQKGSGSSCRSFFSPWSLWHDHGAEAIQIPYSNLRHQVLLCDESIKQVSSSEAHLRVVSSDLFKGRPQRAQTRLDQLVQSLREKNWQKSYEICWNEFWDMHGLFHTSSPSFFYMNDVCFKLLQELHQYWLAKKDGPLITMDAGANIHLLYREDQEQSYLEVINLFKNRVAIWTDKGYLAKSK